MSCLRHDYIRVTVTDVESKIADALEKMAGKIYLGIITKVLELGKMLDYDEQREGKFCITLESLGGPSIMELSDRIRGEDDISEDQITAEIAKQFKGFVADREINKKLQVFATQYRELKSLRGYKITPKQDRKKDGRTIDYWEILLVEQNLWWICC